MLCLISAKAGQQINILAKYFLRIYVTKHANLFLVLNISFKLQSKLAKKLRCINFARIGTVATNI